MISYIERDGERIAQVQGIAMHNAADVLDLMATAYYNGCNRILARKEDFADAFFDLKTRIAGEILQKFSTYGVRLAIVGDFSQVTSKSLKDFIYECNKGNQVFFQPTHEDALTALLK